MSRVALLEQRVDALEDALRLQSAIIGRCLALADDNTPGRPTHEWLLQLGRNARLHDPQDRLGHPVIAALLHGNAVAWEPTMEALDDALASPP